MDQPDYLSPITLPVFPEAQSKLEQFWHSSQDQTETTRIALAQELCANWKFASELLPAVASRSDYWYLIQIFALNRHWHTSKNVYHFNLNQPQSLLVENFSEGNIKNSGLWQLLLITSEQPLTNRLASQETVLKLISKQGPQVIQQLGLPTHYQLRLLRFDEYLRLATKFGWGSSHWQTLLEGWRQTNKGQVKSLSAGQQLLGGATFIDSWWPNLINHRVYIRLVIETHEK